MINRRQFIAGALASLYAGSSFGQRNNEVPVLIYHDIRDKPDDIYSVSPRQFKQQMEYLYRHGYTTTTFDRIAAGEFKEKQVILTFDDGYKSFIDIAAPILKHYEFSSVVNVIGEYIGRDMPDVGETRTMMTMKDYGTLLEHYDVEIGCHTHGLHHPNENVTLVHERMILMDFAMFYMTMKSTFGYTPTILSWPYGKYTLESMKEAKKVFKYILTSNLGKVDKNTSLDEIPRINIDGNITLQQFKNILTQ